MDASGTIRTHKGRLESIRTHKALLIIIIITDFCIAPFPAVGPIKGVLQKNRKAIYTNSTVKKYHYIHSDFCLFLHTLFLNKVEKLLTLTVETEKETKKDYRKHKKGNKQGSIDLENKTNSKYIDFRQTL